MERYEMFYIGQFGKLERVPDAAVPKARAILVFLIRILRIVDHRSDPRRGHSPKSIPSHEERSSRQWPAHDQADRSQRPSHTECDILWLDWDG